MKVVVAGLTPAVYREIMSNIIDLARGLWGCHGHTRTRLLMLFELFGDANGVLIQRQMPSTLVRQCVDLLLRNEHPGYVRRNAYLLASPCVPDQPYPFWRLPKGRWLSDSEAQNLLDVLESSAFIKKLKADREQQHKKENDDLAALRENEAVNFLRGLGYQVEAP